MAVIAGRAAWVFSDASIKWVSEAVGATSTVADMPAGYWESQSLLMLSPVYLL